jgi:hypothetical protein
MFKFKSQMTGCLSMTGRLQNLPLTTAMYNTHINHSSKAMVFLLLKRHNVDQLWNSVTVASSDLFELRDTMYRAKVLACFPLPLMGGRCKMRSRPTKMRKQVESNDSSDDTDSMLGTEVVTSKPCIAGDSHEEVRSTRSKRK